jgi:ELWxxDGT repeat protein
MEPHQEDMMSHQGWIRSSVSRLVKMEKKGNSGRLSGRPRGANSTRLRSVESLEERTLLSTVSVEPIQDVKTVDLYPAQLTPAGSNLFYVVEDSSNDGEDLVVTNSSGTQVVKDFPDAATAGSSAPTDITAFGNDVDFITSAGSSTAYDNMLWQSDGTAGGTTQVSIPGMTVTSFQSLTDLNGTLIVVLNVGSGIDNQMWAIGGNGATPVLIEDFGDVYATPDQVIGDTLYFSVGGDLWSTGGAAGNTQAVGSSVATPQELVSYAGQAYYFSNSNGQVVFGTVTPSGETQVGTAAISSVVGAAVSGSSLYFVGAASSTSKATQLWVTNGTQGGTQLVEDFSTISPLSVPLNLTDANGTLFFTLEDADGLEELWESNGTSQGTSLVKDLGTSALYSGYAGYLTSLEAIGGTVYFTAYDTTYGAELWETDGTSQGTQLVKDINPGPAGSDPQGFVEFDDQLYFAAHDGSSPQQNELWTSNGTAVGTVMVASFNPGVTQGSSSLTPGSTDFATLGSVLLLPLEDGIHGPELWGTDGTSAGTILLAPVNPRAIAVLGSDAYFIGSRPTSLGLWVTDGTAAGTTEVLDLTKYEDSSSFFVTPSLVASGGKLYFTTSDGGGGVDLWTSGGTAASTSVVEDFTAPSGESTSNVSISDLTAFNGELAFLANDGTHGTQLWISNGTATGTQMVTDVSSSGEPPSDPTAVGGSLYFFAPDPTTSDEDLWVTNGTVGGTSTVASIPTFTPSSQSTAYAAITTDLTAVASRVFFLVQYDYSASGQGGLSTQAQLWTSDGTSQGTVALPAPASGSMFSSLGAFEPLGNLLLFQAVETSGGPLELWKSDGTAAGTALITDISGTSTATSVPSYSASLAVNGILYFAANDGVHGNELWQSNGIPAGTGLVADINPGMGSSSPVPLASLGGQLVLVADDGIHGEQLMEAILQPAPTPSPTTPTSTPSPAPPRIAPIPTQAADEGTTIQVNLESFASDPNTPALSLTYSLAAGAPSGVGINPTSGLLTWTVPADQMIGTYPVTVVATDSGTPAQSTSATFNLDVIDPGPAPTISTATVSIKHGFAITLTFSQPLDQATALDASNYLLAIPAKPVGKHHKGPAPQPTPIPLGISYDAATNQVTLRAIGRVNLLKPLQFTVVGTAPGGVAKVTGLLLAGSGQAGTDYLATVTPRKVKPVASGALAVRADARSTGHPSLEKPEARTEARISHRTAAAPVPVRPSSQGLPGGPMALAVLSASPRVFGIIPPAEKSRGLRR